MRIKTINVCVCELRLLEREREEKSIAITVLIFLLLQQLHVFDRIHDRDALVALLLRQKLLISFLLFLLFYCVQQMASLLLENPI